MTRHSRLTILCGICFCISACAGKPLMPFPNESAPLALLPAGQQAVIDKRGRFREIACAVLETHGKDQPHYRDCDDALVRIGDEPEGTGEPVDLNPSKRHLKIGFVPGIGWDCLGNWIDEQDSFANDLGPFGYSSFTLKIDGLSGTNNNAKQIRDSIMEQVDEIEPASMVLIAHSKGAPDALTAIVSYPEIRQYIAAVVSLAGAIGGSPLAYDVSNGKVRLLRRLLNSGCKEGDGLAIESLKPEVRQAWLLDNRLPGEIKYYSLVAYPLPGQVSSVFKFSYNKLSRIDPRNDSKLMFYDQVIPGSTLLGYLNADHMAVVAPISEKHEFIGDAAVNRNDFPRQAIAEAVMRFVEEDLSKK